MSEGSGRRILVIDDSQCRIETSLKFFGPRARNILVAGNDWALESARGYAQRRREMYGKDICIDVGGEDLIARALSEEQYKFVLLDGNLNLELEGEYFDGKVIARRLRNGLYGEANLRTVVLSTSSQGRRVIPGADGEFSLEDGKWNLEKAKELLEQ